MTLDDEQPGSLVARVAPVADEIAAARARGVTWRRIVEVVGERVGLAADAPAAPQRLRQAHAAAVKAIAAGRLRPTCGPPLATATNAGKQATPTPLNRLGRPSQPADGAVDDIEEMKARFDIGRQPHLKEER